MTIVNNTILGKYPNGCPKERYEEELDRTIGEMERKGYTIKEEIGWVRRAKMR